MTTLNWKVSTKDRELIDKIAHRAKALAARFDIKYPWHDAMMDVTATHTNGMPLDLDGLLKTDDGNFGHDVFGIRRHLNRETGKLMDCFRPRYAKGATT